MIGHLATVGPVHADAVGVGVFLKSVLLDPGEVDEQVCAWLAESFDAATD